MEEYVSSLDQKAGLIGVGISGHDGISGSLSLSPERERERERWILLCRSSYWSGALLLTQLELVIIMKQECHPNQGWRIDQIHVIIQKKYSHNEMHLELGSKKASLQVLTKSKVHQP